MAKLSAAAIERSRTEVRLTIIGAVVKCFEKSGMNQSELALRLGVSRQAISKLFTGPGSRNWTLDKIGDLLAAMDATILKIDVRHERDCPPSKVRHPWLKGAVSKRQ